MQGDSSNPPCVKNTTIPCAPPYCDGSSHPPTHEVIVDNGGYRDTLVGLCRPCAVPTNMDPKESLVEEAMNRFQKQGAQVDRDQVAEAVDFILERHLIEYHPDRRSYFPTAKTQQLLRDLYIVICGNCKATVVKPLHEEGTPPALIMCHRCEEIV